LIIIAEAEAPSAEDMPAGGLGNKDKQDLATARRKSLRKRRKPEARLSARWDAARIARKEEKCEAEE